MDAAHFLHACIGRKFPQNPGLQRDVSSTFRFVAGPDYLGAPGPDMRNECMASIARCYLLRHPLDDPLFFRGRVYTSAVLLSICALTIESGHHEEARLRR